jgi:hypothetical protein
MVAGSRLKVSPPTCDFFSVKHFDLNGQKTISFEPLGNFTNLKRNFQTNLDPPLKLSSPGTPLPQIFGMAHGWAPSRFEKGIF